MIGYIFGAYFKQFSLLFPDVNKDKGVADTAPLDNIMYKIYVHNIKHFSINSFCARFPAIKGKQTFEITLKILWEVHFAKIRTLLNTGAPASKRQ